VLLVVGEINGSVVAGMNRWGQGRETGRFEEKTRCSQHHFARTDLTHLSCTEHHGGGDGGCTPLLQSFFPFCISAAPSMHRRLRAPYQALVKLPLPRRPLLTAILLILGMQCCRFCGQPWACIASPRSQSPDLNCYVVLRRPSRDGRATC
jgi:hypothetical protein